MRTALVIVAAAVALFVGGWVIDDKIFGADVPRNRAVAGIDVGRLSIDEAATRIADARLDGQVIQLRHETDSLITTRSRSRGRRRHDRRPRRRGRPAAAVAATLRVGGVAVRRG